MEEATTFEVLAIEPDDGFATLWLDAPERRNAMGRDFWRELPVAIEQLASDEGVRAVVIAARGPHFSTGLDLKEEATGDRSSRKRRSSAERGIRLEQRLERMQRAITAVAECPLPVIAAVHGYCLGGGIDLITACDVRLAATDAVFSVRETRMAIVADVGTLQRLPGIVGRGIASELCLTGDDVTAERALQIQLVNAVYPDLDETLAAARAMAHRIARNSPLAVQGTKRVLRYSEGKSVEDGLEYVRTLNATYLQSDDLKEATLAFAEKREPKFTGS